MWSDVDQVKKCLAEFDKSEVLNDSEVEQHVGWLRRTVPMRWVLQRTYPHDVSCECACMLEYMLTEGHDYLLEHEVDYPDTWARIIDGGLHLRSAKRLDLWAEAMRWKLQGVTIGSCGTSKAGRPSMAAHVARHGVIRPIVVDFFEDGREMARWGPGWYVVEGHHRVCMAALLGIDRVPMVMACKEGIDAGRVLRAERSDSFRPDYMGVRQILKAAQEEGLTRRPSRSLMTSLFRMREVGEEAYLEEIISAKYNHRSQPGTKPTETWSQQTRGGSRWG